MKNEIKFKECMAMMCELHDRSASKLLTDLYWKVLEPYTDEQCEAAFKELIYSSKFFPKPADFIESIQGTKKNRATEAWLDVLGSVVKIGNYQSVKFADPIIHSVVQTMGGWPELCMMENDQVIWKQREFERLYEVMALRDGKHPDYLPGTHELENFRTGFEVENHVVRVGYDNKKLKLIQ